MTQSLQLWPQMYYVQRPPMSLTLHMWVTPALHTHVCSTEQLSSEDISQMHAPSADRGCQLLFISVNHTCWPHQLIEELPVIVYINKSHMLAPSADWKLPNIVFIHMPMMLTTADWDVTNSWFTFKYLSKSLRCKLVIYISDHVANCLYHSSVGYGLDAFKQENIN